MTQTKFPSFNPIPPQPDAQPSNPPFPSFPVLGSGGGFLTTNLHVEVFRTAAFTVANTFVFVTVPWDTLETGVISPSPLINLTTGVFTCPIPGIYDVRCFLIFSTATAGSIGVELNKNGSPWHRIGTAYSGTGNPAANGAGKARCAAGDTLAISVGQNTATNPASLFTGSDLCWAAFAYAGPLN